MNFFKYVEEKIYNIPKIFDTLTHLYPIQMRKRDEGRGKRDRKKEGKDGRIAFGLSIVYFECMVNVRARRFI